MNSDKRVPVTILTGFLGSGKTTMLNRILSENHGKRIAVIENEYGEVGIDHELVINSDEEIFQMSNGCICCAIRGDLIRILGNLMKRRDRFDYVLVETTGLADPGPVAQTFFADEEIRAEFTLDGIVTLVDTANIEQQLIHSKESTEQVAFADVLVLNKTDLAANSNLDQLESRLKTINPIANIVRCEKAEVPIDKVLNLSAFNLKNIFERRPGFVHPDFPFEWTGVYNLNPGRYRFNFDDGPEPAMSIVILANKGSDDRSLRGGANRSEQLYLAPAKTVQPGQDITAATHLNLELHTQGKKEFFFEVTETVQAQVFTQFAGPKFNFSVHHNEQVIPALVQRVWVTKPDHNAEVGSFTIQEDGDVDSGMLNAWIAKLLREDGSDIFRIKGFVSLEGQDDRFVFQSVHMLFDGKYDKPWGDMPRRNQLVFIGRNLNEQKIRRGFEACLT